jgi:hypothetical protein
MKVLVDYGDGTEPEELEVTDGSMHFHPFPDDLEEGSKPEPTVEVLEEDVPEPDEVDDAESAVEDFDPEAHTVAEVEAYVTDHPEEADGIYDMEEEGKNRTTLMSWLLNFIDSRDDEGE